MKNTIFTILLSLLAFVAHSQSGRVSTIGNLDEFITETEAANMINDSSIANVDKILDANVKRTFWVDPIFDDRRLFIGYSDDVTESNISVFLDQEYHAGASWTQDGFNAIWSNGDWRSQLRAGANGSMEVGAFNQAYINGGAEAVNAKHFYARADFNGLTLGEGNNNVLRITEDDPGGRLMIHNKYILPDSNMAEGTILIAVADNELMPVKLTEVIDTSLLYTGFSFITSSPGSVQSVINKEYYIIDGAANTITFEFDTDNMPIGGSFFLKCISGNTNIITLDPEGATTILDDTSGNSTISISTAREDIELIWMGSFWDLRR